MLNDLNTKKYTTVGAILNNRRKATARKKYEVMKGRGKGRSNICREREKTESGYYTDTEVSGYGGKMETGTGEWDIER